MTNSYPRESIELVPLEVKVNGVAVTDYSTALVPSGTRPETWVAAVTVGAATGLMLPGNLTPGPRQVFAKVTGSPETPVIDLGIIKIT